MDQKSISARTRRRLTRPDEHPLADPALAVAAPGLTEEASLQGGGERSGFPPDGTLLGHLFKLTRTVRDDDVRHLLWLDEKLGPDLLDTVVVNTGPFAYRRDDGVAVVPASLLGP